MSDCELEWETHAGEEDSDGDGYHVCSRGDHGDDLHVCHLHIACWPLQGIASWAS